jgi:hypothetical protein
MDEVTKDGDIGVCKTSIVLFAEAAAKKSPIFRLRVGTQAFVGDGSLKLC